jgi:hypothetical protein
MAFILACLRIFVCREKFSKEGLALIFTVNLGGAAEGRGVVGVLRVRGERQGFCDMKADVRSLDLGDIEWVNPENLAGSAGEMKGSFTFRVDAGGRPFCEIRLRVEEPGGKLQARFFETLKPYLPQLAVQQKVEEIAGKQALVDFREAELRLDLAESDRMKIFLHIAVPDYNLDLNLNIELRVDSENAFADVAGLVGLIRRETSG